jgi:hypothetical protein
MRRTTAVALVGILLLLTLLLGCTALSLGVRTGQLSEVLLRFPPQNRYQLILRVGDDARPWERGRRPRQALNLWVHGTGTDWHIIRLIYIPLGNRALEEEQYE